MLSSLRRSALLATLAILGAGSMPAVMANQPALISAAPRPIKTGKRSLFGGAIQSASRYGRKGAGISMAQQQRASRKKRGVARNRVNHR
jgi:hypothetical protein